MGQGPNWPAGATCLGVLFLSNDSLVDFIYFQKKGEQSKRRFRRYIASFSLQKKMRFNEKVEALPADEFVSNYPEVRAKAFPGGNVGQLIVFPQSRYLSFTPFGGAHTQIMLSRGAIAT